MGEIREADRQFHIVIQIEMQGFTLLLLSRHIVNYSITIKKTKHYIYHIY